MTKRKAEAEVGEKRYPLLGLRKRVIHYDTCRCGDQAGVALKIIRHAFENRAGAKIHMRMAPDRPARARQS